MDSCTHTTTRDRRDSPASVGPGTPLPRHRSGACILQRPAFWGDGSLPAHVGATRGGPPGLREDAVENAACELAAILLRVAVPQQGFPERACEPQGCRWRNALAAVGQGERDHGVRKPSAVNVVSGIQSDP